CRNACFSASTSYRCTPTGCVADSSCSDTTPACFDSQQLCEDSGCVPNTPTPLPSCSNFATQATCDPQPNCAWRNGVCVIGANPASPTPAGVTPSFDLCANINNAAQHHNCEDCKGRGGIFTGLGCIHYDTTRFTQDVFKIIFS